MGFFSRFRFLIGILLVGGIVTGLFLYLNYSMSNVASQSATLESDSYAVSVEYGGTVEKQYVTAGKAVKKGDPLFELRSASLAEAQRTGQATTTLPFTTTDTGNILVTANNNGIVRQVNFLPGAFVAANMSIAVIDIDNTQYVTAKYLLRAPDYARINRSNPVEVTLPDNTKLNATVFDISLQKDGEKVYTIVKARFNKDAWISPTFTSGTPVSATWQLENSNWYNAIVDVLKSLIEPTSQQ